MGHLRSHWLLSAAALSLSFAATWGTCSAQIVPPGQPVTPGDPMSPGNAMPSNAPGVAPSADNTNTISSNSFDRGRNISVRQRARPDYQAEGVEVGGFMVYPKLVAGVTYDSNIFSVPSAPTGDFIFSQIPEVDIQSTWARNSLTAYAKAEGDEYASHSAQDDLQYGLGVAGKYEFLTNSQADGGVDFAHDVLPRSASNNVGFSVHPIGYDLTTSHAEFATTFTRMRLTARVDDQNYDYGNGVTPTGTFVNEQQFDHNSVLFTGKAEFAVTPDTAVFLTAMGNDRVYKYQPPAVQYDLNSSGYEIDAGANFDITHLVRGEVQVGYLRQTYTAGTLFKPISGPSAKAQIEWFPTQLTTVTVGVNRAVGDAGVPGSAGFLLTSTNVEIDHELMRNVILSANGVYATDDYNGVDRTDHVISGGAGATWLLTRHVGVTLGYTYGHQDSYGAQRGASYSDNRVMLSANLQY